MLTRWCISRHACSVGPISVVECSFDLILLMSRNETANAAPLNRGVIHENDIKLGNSQTGSQHIPSNICANFQETPKS